MTAQLATTEWQSVDHDLATGIHNWSGSLRFRPSRIEFPRNEEDLSKLVIEAGQQNRRLRPIGSGHSSTPIIATDDLLVNLDNLGGMENCDENACEATFGAGTKLTAVGEQLQKVGLSMPNFGDVATQTVAGAIGTGTHGSGRDLYNLSMTLVGGRLVIASGEVKEVSFEKNPDVVRAARVSMGTLGIFSSMRLKLERFYKLRRQEWCCPFSVFRKHIERLSRENRNFDFYWFPRDDGVQFRCLNRLGEETDYSDFARLKMDRVGPPHEVIPKHSNIPFRFDEMEYSMAADDGLDCLMKLREQIMRKWRRTVGWRLLYRFIKADDTWLSEAHGRETISISLHQNASLPFSDYFTSLEPIFWKYDGRPHWAKKHNLRAENLRKLYPKWNEFMELRRRLDPDGRFLSPYLMRILDT